MPELTELTRIGRIIVMASIAGVMIPAARADGPPDDAAYYGLRDFCTAPSVQIMTILNTPSLVHAGASVCRAADLALGSTRK